MFLGKIFMMGNTAISNTPASSPDFNNISLSNLTLDELYATEKVLVEFTWSIPTEWDFDTLMHVEYQNDLFAGNVKYSADMVDYVRIKKRYAGDFQWKAIYEKPINVQEDFYTEFYDYYSPSNVNVEYAYVVVIGGVETFLAYTSTTSIFNSYFIVDANAAYPMIIDAKNEVTYNRESATVVSPGRKYPYVIHNGIAKYYSGSMTATFIDMSNCKIDVENGWKYRNQIDEYLTDGNPKILKSFEGDIYMVNITGSLPRSYNDHYQYVTHKFDWVEAGDPNSIADLYDNGFINTDVDRE